MHTKTFLLNINSIALHLIKGLLTLMMMTTHSVGQVPGTAEMRLNAGTKLTVSGRGPRSMEGAVTNSFGKASGSITIEIFWAGKPNSSKQRRISKTHQFSAAVAPKEKYAFNSSADDPALTHKIDPTEGWLVIVRDKTSNQILLSQSNSSDLDRLAKQSGSLDGIELDRPVTR